MHDSLVTNPRSDADARQGDFAHWLALVRRDIGEQSTETGDRIHAFSQGEMFVLPEGRAPRFKASSRTKVDRWA
jgi:hypothetical protein